MWDNDKACRTADVVMNIPQNALSFQEEQVVLPRVHQTSDLRNTDLLYGTLQRIGASDSVLYLHMPSVYNCCSMTSRPVCSGLQAMLLAGFLFSPLVCSLY